MRAFNPLRPVRHWYARSAPRRTRTRRLARCARVPRPLRRGTLGRPIRTVTTAVSIRARVRPTALVSS